MENRILLMIRFSSFHIAFNEINGSVFTSTFSIFFFLYMCSRYIWFGKFKLYSHNGITFKRIKFVSTVEKWIFNKVFQKEKENKIQKSERINPNESIHKAHIHALCNQNDISQNNEILFRISIGVDWHAHSFFHRFSNIIFNRDIKLHRVKCWYMAWNRFNAIAYLKMKNFQLKDTFNGFNII